MTKPVVLFVDDEADILESFGLLFELAATDIMLVTCPGGSAALQELERRDVAAVVSDYRMPTMNGIELLEEVRRRKPMLLAILSTAYGDERLYDQARERVPGIHIMAKPLDVDDFLRTLRAALEMS